MHALFVTRTSASQFDFEFDGVVMVYVAVMVSPRWTPRKKRKRSRPYDTAGRPID
ncbi:hypothetical protein [Bradyrhizobium sp. BR 1432]|uniref:hypothetical protein n=1 Tax=Bradyrhizobium sp. BR 1432 TaxID=3447966 RepID=UPI003EE7D8D9